MKAIEKCVEYPLLLNGDMEEFTISNTDSCKDDESDTIVQVLDSVMSLVRVLKLSFTGYKNIVFRFTIPKKMLTENFKAQFNRILKHPYAVCNIMNKKIFD